MNLNTKKVFPWQELSFSIMIWLLLATSLITFTLSSCGKKEAEESETPLKGVEVSTGNPVSVKMNEYLDLNANTTFLSQEIVRATFPGFITKTDKNLGDQVKKGDRLFSIKTKEASAVDSTELGKQFNGIVNVYARTNGILTELSYQTGDYVTETDRLALIVDPASLRILLNVPFQYSKNIVESASFPIRLPDNKEFSARVEKKLPSIDVVNQTQSFILQPNSEINVPANLNLIVKIPLKTIVNAIALPKSAVVTNETESEFWVMKLLNDSIAVKLDVKRGIEADSLVQITEPALSLNDRFITEGAYGLPDTVKIVIKK
ncbi:MAG: efflux RND transporter periplasmic adaptor subunit [Ignavibacteriaceae bacterium]|nr:efflux RND transporter periplasmic adaptor subunit [Ignavibacteriaceae bacterium]